MEAQCARMSGVVSQQMCWANVQQCRSMSSGTGGMFGGGGSVGVPDPRTEGALIIPDYLLPQTCTAQQQLQNQLPSLGMDAPPITPQCQDWLAGRGTGQAAPDFFSGNPGAGPAAPDFFNINPGAGSAMDGAAAMRGLAGVVGILVAHGAAPQQEVIQVVKDCADSVPAACAALMPNLTTICQNGAAAFMSGAPQQTLDETTAFACAFVESHR
jgi:hypothetical protein